VVGPLVDVVVVLVVELVVLVVLVVVVVVELVVVVVVVVAVELVDVGAAPLPMDESPASGAEFVSAVHPVATSSKAIAVIATRRVG
jgi:hypothetical protein